jgi:hypothetical protein
MDDGQRAKLGEIADWLTGRLSRILAKHGVAIGIVVALILAGIVFAGWYIDRGPIPPAAGPAGPAQSWTFPADLAAAQVLKGDWQLGDQGVCRINPEQPKPGSEKPGLIALQPGAVYGNRPFSFSARDFIQRPRLGEGTMMDAGIAFGIRDADNFYLLRQSALHDVVVLERYVHGRKRDMREEHEITRGNNTHTLGVQVDGGVVTALLDGQPIFQTDHVVDTDGGIGLWSRVTATGCFSEAQVMA